MRRPTLGTTFQILSMSIAFALCYGEMALAQDASLPSYLTQHEGRTDPQSIPTNEVLWAVFETVATLDVGTPGVGAKFLQANGLSEHDALAFSAHIHASINDVRAHAAELWATLCADTTAPAGSRDLLVRSYQAIDASMDDRRALHLRQLDGVISSAGKETLVAWANRSIRPNLKITSVDHAKRFAVENVDASAEIARFCTRRDRSIVAAKVPQSVSAPNGVTVTPIVR